MAGQEEGAGQENYPDREGGAGAERIRGEESLISSPVVGGGWVGELIRTTEIELH